MQKTIILENIDLTKSANNFPYLNSDTMNSQFDVYDDLPVEPEKSDWEVVDNQLRKTYKIDNRGHFFYFVQNLLARAEQVSHDPTVGFQFPFIEVTLQTHDLNQVTELDLEYSRFLDEIYEDITFLADNF